jgi:hypothetical protein
MCWPGGSTRLPAAARGCWRRALDLSVKTVEGHLFWKIPGRDPLSLDYRCHAEVLRYFAHFMELSNGTFRIRIDDILAEEDRFGVLCTESAQRGNHCW